MTAFPNGTQSASHLPPRVIPLKEVYSSRHLGANGICQTPWRLAVCGKRPLEGPAGPFLTPSQTERAGGRTQTKGPDGKSVVNDGGRGRTAGRLYTILPPHIWAKNGKRNGSPSPCAQPCGQPVDDNILTVTAINIYILANTMVSLAPGNAPRISLNQRLAISSAHRS